MHVLDQLKYACILTHRGRKAKRVIRVTTHMGFSKKIYEPLKIQGLTSICLETINDWK